MHGCPICGSSGALAVAPWCSRTSPRPPSPPPALGLTWVDEVEGLTTPCVYLAPHVVPLPMQLPIQGILMVLFFSLAVVVPSSPIGFYGVPNFYSNVLLLVMCFDGGHLWGVASLNCGCALFPLCG